MTSECETPGTLTRVEDSGTPVEKREGQGEKILISLDRSTHWEEGTQKEQDRASEEAEEELCC